MTRQSILTADDPVSLDVVLDESCLRRSVSGAEVMAERMRKLLDVDERPNVRIRVLPYSAGAHVSPDGGFTLIRLTDPFPMVAYTVGGGGGVYTAWMR